MAHARSVYDIVLCVYERFRVDGLKRYLNGDRFRVDGDKDMRLIPFAFTIVFVWTGPYKEEVRSYFCRYMKEHTLERNLSNVELTAVTRPLQQVMD